MAREEGKILEPGDMFPEMEFESIKNGSIVLPRDISGKWSILLFYRGYW